MAGESTGTTSTPLSTGVVPAAASGVQPYTSTAGLSGWAQPYVSDMLGTASTLADKPYTPYTGQLTAGQTGLQTSALSGIGALTAPTTQTWSALGQSERQKFMNPYIEDVLNPQIEEAKRQSQIQNLQNRTQLTKAGAYGGGRGALMESEAQRNLQQNLAGITGKGYASAYDQAVAQFNKEQDQGLAALKSAQDLYGSQYGLGEKSRQIEQEGLASAYQQWQQKQQFPYEQLKFQQSMLSGLPITEQKVTTPAKSPLSQFASGLNALVGGGSSSVMSLLKAAGIVDQNTTAMDLIKKGFGGLFGENSPYQITSTDAMNMSDYVTQQVNSGVMSPDQANAAMNAFFGSSGVDYYNTAGDYAPMTEADWASLGISGDLSGYESNDTGFNW